jgi:hypothetical protein
MVDVEVTESASREISLTGGSSFYDLLKAAMGHVFEAEKEGWRVTFASGGVVIDEPNKLYISMERAS